MSLKIFTVYDSKANAYLQPFFMRSHGEAIRAVTDLVCEKNHQFNRHTADFTLFVSGEYDENTGIIETFIPPRVLGNFLEYANPDSDDGVGEGVPIPAFLKQQA